MNTDANKIALDAIAESLATGGAYITIPEIPGVIDALCERAGDWADQGYGIGITGGIESADGSIIDEWNVFVTYTARKTVEVTDKELLILTAALGAYRRELQALCDSAGDAAPTAYARELDDIRVISELEITVRDAYMS